MQFRYRQHVTPNGVNQWSQQRAGCADPARQQRAIEVVTATIWWRLNADNEMAP